MTSRDVRRGFLAIAATFAELEELLELREERPPLDDTVYRSLKNRWATNQILAWLAGTDCPRLMLCEPRNGTHIPKILLGEGGTIWAPPLFETPELPRAARNYLSWSKFSPAIFSNENLPQNSCWPTQDCASSAAVMYFPPGAIPASRPEWCYLGHFLGAPGAFFIDGFGNRGGTGKRNRLPG